MADGLVDDALGGLKSFFSQSDLNDPRVNSALRQRIAYEMMKKQPYPKTVGEGLAAIGNSLGDIGMARQLARADVAAQDAGVKLYDQGQKPVAPPAETPRASVFDTGTKALAGMPPVVAQDDDNENTPPAPATPPASTGPSVAEATAANSLVNPQRNAMTAALMQQQAAGGPQPNPTLEGGQDPSQPPSPDMLASPIQTSPTTPIAASNPIRVATADPSGIVLPNIRPAPPEPLRVAQANPPARYDYVMPKPGAAPQPPQMEKTPQEMNIERMIIQNQGNPYAVQGLEILRKDLEGKRLYQDKQNAERYQNQLLQERELEMKRQEQLQERAKRATEGRIQEQGVIAPPAAQTPLPGVGVDPRLGTENSPQRTGIPSAPPVPPGISRAQHAAAQAPILTQAAQVVTKAEPEFQRSIDLLRRLGSHPGREWGVGPTGRIAGQIPGTAAFGFHQLLNQLNGKEFLEAYQSLRGGGQISNVEGGKAQDAIAALNAAQSKDDFDTALLNLEKVMRSDLELAQRKSNRPVTAWQKDSNDNYAPDIGERGMRKGVAVEYIGGNPADDRSYRRVQ